MKKEKVIEISDVIKTYPAGDETLTVLNKVNLTIHKGEFVSVIGPSGSGKSTLMHILGLLDHPTSGRYLLNGEDVSELKEDKLAGIRNKEIGFVFQSFNLLARTSALTNVELPMVYAGVSQGERTQIARRLLDDVGLSNKVENKPNQLSGGQQQRVAIARALANNPSIILADEPTGNLDSKSSSEVMEILKDLNKVGKTIILITHEPVVANEAKRIIEIKDGSIVSDKPN
jgi:putative ABC transport system ATP-binding protein